VSVFREAGLSVVLLLNFECLCLGVDTVHTLAKILLQLYDERCTAENRHWEQRRSLVHHTELYAECLILVATLAHCLHIFLLQGFTASLLDAVLIIHVRLTVKKLHRRYVEHRRYRRLVDFITATYPTVHAATFASDQDDLCLICRDPMAQAKRLPCQHLFHASCLHGWLDQHRTCPTCRGPLLPQAPAHNVNTNAHVNGNAATAVNGAADDGHATAAGLPPVLPPPAPAAAVGGVLGANAPPPAHVHGNNQPPFDHVPPMYPPDHNERSVFSFSSLYLSVCWFVVFVVLCLVFRCVCHRHFCIDVCKM
jgi:Ring finger domain